MGRHAEGREAQVQGQPRRKLLGLRSQRDEAGLARPQRDVQLAALLRRARRRRAPLEGQGGQGTVFGGILEEGTRAGEQDPGARGAGARDSRGGRGRRWFRERHRYDRANRCMMRLMRYHKLKDYGDEIPGHTDFNSLTMLFSPSIAALQVLCRDNRWRFVKPLEDAVICNRHAAVLDRRLPQVDAAPRGQRALRARAGHRAAQRHLLPLRQRRRPAPPPPEPLRPQEAPEGGQGTHCRGMGPPPRRAQLQPDGDGPRGQPVPGRDRRGGGAEREGEGGAVRRARRRSRWAV